MTVTPSMIFKKALLPLTHLLINKKFPLFHGYLCFFWNLGANVNCLADGDWIVDSCEFEIDIQNPQWFIIWKVHGFLENPVSSTGNNERPSRIVRLKNRIWFTGSADMNGIAAEFLNRWKFRFAAAASEEGRERLWPVMRWPTRGTWKFFSLHITDTSFVIYFSFCTIK